MIDYFKNKRVALVGPASSIHGSNLGKKIDSYDLVCRLNLGFPLPKSCEKDAGSKCNILYTTGSVPKALSENVASLKEHLDFIVLPFPKTVKPFDLYHKRFKNQYKNSIPHFTPYDHKSYLEIENKIGSRPTIGLISIEHLLSTELTELFISGLTFYQTGYSPFYSNDKPESPRKEDASLSYSNVKSIGVHDPSLELIYFYKLFQANKSRITLDKKLLSIINECHENYSSSKN